MSVNPVAVSACLAFAYLTASQVSPADVQVRQDAAAKQYVVTIGGKPFTTYRHGEEFPDKPVFYPVMSPNGARVNREYPMVAKVPGESADHPHHQSIPVKASRLQLASHRCYRLGMRTVLR